jgi:DNA-binding winged helix-turn-helix (wHTH) protein/TolB-like protein
MREYEFAGFRLNVLKRQLSNAKREVLELPARAFDALVFLVEHRGEDIGKEQIMKAVWPDTIVEENNLNQAIFALRRALGDSASEPRFIMTLPGRGYRFVAELGVVRLRRHAASRQKIAVLGIVTLCAIVALSWGVWRNQQAHDAPVSIAVLPFKTLLQDQSNPALELGMTNSLIGQLSEIPRVKVSSLGAVRRFGASNQDPLEAGRSLAVKNVLESYIVRQGDRVRVTARLLRVQDGQSLWSGHFDEAFSDIFSVQDSIAERVTGTLAPHLSLTTSITRRVRRTENAEAYQLFTEGFYNQQRRDKDSLPDAVNNYEAALLLDPGYVDAWSNLSRALALQGVFGTRPPATVFPRAKQAALRALELNPESAEAHAAYAHVLVVYDRQYKLADEHYAIAKRLDPSVPEFYLLDSLNKANLGRMGEALDEIRHAIEIEPASPLFRSILGMMLFLNREYDEAERELRRIIELQPRFDGARHTLGRLLAVKGDYPSALEQFAARTSSTVGSYAEPGRTYALMGRKQEALQEVNEIRKRGEQGFAVNYDLASIYAALGDERQACEALSAAVADHVSYVGLMQIDPGLDPLRTQPCFAEIAHQLYDDPRR